ncbi:MAG TPA: PQQ-dependent sugar dehydrogenase [Acidimicrobiia bacterium]|nr:PQQ-dependent sugar dehydrogenase [Acidimicrobiia bacterium]
MTSIVSYALLVALLPLAALAPGGTFTDDDGIVHEGGIEAIASEKITVGCNPPFNDHFCPDRVLTRAEMAAMIARALSLPSGSTDHFVDDDGHVLEGAINRIADAGITLGCNPPLNDRFCPQRSLTRAEAAGFLARALGLPASGDDFFDDDNGHVLEGAINRIADAGITVGCNPPTNNNFCPDRSLTRGEMATMLTRALGLTSMRPAARPPVEWELVVGGLTTPIQTLVPPGEDRILIAELGGLIRVFENGALRPQPFLDLTGTVVAGGERGLLSIAIHPDYPADRRLFAWYSAPLRPGGTGNHTTYLVEFDIAANLQTASSPRTVLAVDQPFANHNGGFVDFGPDGYLYMGLGDGGSGNDPGARARNLNTLLGKMIRIDVDGAVPYGIPADNPRVGTTGRDEIWASGLRNPWRWSIDNGNLYIGDVGQGAREEVDTVALSPVGYDFGWSRYEGTLCNPNDTDPSCSTSGLTMPIVEYGRAVGRVITGGVVYRGPTVRSLNHYYLYADFGSGIVRGFRLLDGKAVETVDLTSALRRPGLVSFGFDSNGEILATSLFDNAVYRLVGG